MPKENKKIKLAIVMPNHANIYSSLQNSLKAYQTLMDNYDVEITILTDSKNELKYGSFKVEKIEGYDYGTILGKILFLLGIPRFYYKNLDEKLQKYDVISANNPEFYAYAYQAFKVAEKHNKRFLLKTSQTKEGFFLYHLTKYIVNPIVRKAYDYASFCIFTNPQAEVRALRLGLLKDKSKSIILGHPTDVEAFKPRDAKKHENTILLSVGGLYKIKGHHLIMQAMKKIIERGNKSIELWIVGEGYYRKNLESLAKELGIESKVRLLGALGHDDLAQKYNESDIFVLANYQEVTPAVNEALASQKPVVVMECGGREFVIPNQEHGLVCKKFDTDDMAKKIEMLIDDKQLAEKIARTGRKRILQEFSIEKVAKKHYHCLTATKKQ